LASPRRARRTKNFRGKGHSAPGPREQKRKKSQIKKRQNRGDTDFCHCAYGEKLPCGSTCSLVRTKHDAGAHKQKQSRGTHLPRRKRKNLSVHVAKSVPRILSNRKKPSEHTTKLLKGKNAEKKTSVQPGRCLEGLGR